MDDIAHKVRYNLYYIFARDKQEHPMPGHIAEAIRAYLMSCLPPKPPD